MRLFRSLSLALSLALAICAPAQTLIDDLQLGGSSNQINSGATFTVVSGGTFVLASGSTFTLPDFTISLAKLSNSGGAEGDIIYWNGTNWIRLARGTDGQFLKSTATTIAWDTVSASAPTDATYITQTASAGLSAEQALGALASGIVRVATTTGVLTSLTDSAGIAANISDETGSGALVFGTSPDFTTGITIGSVAVPTISSTSTLTNKTIDLTSNTLTATSAQLITAISDESGTGAALFGTSPTITTPTISGAIVFPDGVLQTFNPDATNAGINVGSIAGDPSAPTNGDLWYDSTANELSARINGATVALGAGGGGAVGTDVIWDAAGDLAVGTGANTAARLAIGTSGQVLTSNGTTAAWSAPASGGTLTLAKFTALDGQPPPTSFAAFDTRNSISVLFFDADSDYFTVFVSSIPEGTTLTSGLSVRIHWMAETATSGDVMWVSAFERSNTDLDADSFATGVSATTATNGTSGIVTVTTIDHSSAEIDGVTVGDLYRLQISRDANHASDTMTGNAQVIAVEVRAR